MPCFSDQENLHSSFLFYTAPFSMHTYEHDDSLRSVYSGCAGLCAVCVHNRTHCLCDTVFTLGQITLWRQAHVGAGCTLHQTPVHNCCDHTGRVRAVHAVISDQTLVAL